MLRYYSDSLAHDKSGKIAYKAMWKGHEEIVSLLAKLTSH
jgi:hypothetical protein